MKTELSERIVVQVSAEDLENGVYIDNRNCPLALAVKRLYPERDIDVSVSELYIDDIEYTFPYYFNRLLNELSGDFTGEPLEIVLIKN